LDEKIAFGREITAGTVQMQLTGSGGRDIDDLTVDSGGNAGLPDRPGSRKPL
jgi:hypothetical protein